MKIVINVSKNKMLRELSIKILLHVRDRQTLNTTNPRQTNTRHAKPIERQTQETTNLAGYVLCLLYVCLLCLVSVCLGFVNSCVCCLGPVIVPL